ncbi:NADP-dependent 3-hydroxy acid dehydrogenase YdfG [Lipingzhangella halophila]|uniref:NADP-dependent 3-hydroxy acid dehydrogenase YdfG n=1 Tax=Lipingzhangella halophila TaxID=1783352 RepID=A0A7W7RIS5_9ACTN|nr:SDR family oxidoreductase [Lipingzhangella halophila]MBB4932662.1 NADP-dependent 3-hydroxy acid dehydrogenase YdfG [Lipingzhangella halophila]
MAPVTLITGGSTGIGAATARRLLDAGHRVAVTGRDEDRLAAFADSVASGTDQLMTLPGDTGEHADVLAAVESTVRAWGRLDNAIANAGFTAAGTVADQDPEAMRAMVLTNVLGPSLVVRECLPHLRETNGRIVLVGSVAGEKNTPGNLYSVTKWAVRALAENTRMLVTGDGVGVTLVAPGLVDTPFWEGRGLPDRPAMTADQIADCVVFALNQPAGLDINSIVVRPIGQPN